MLSDVAVDRQGDIYLVELLGNRVRRITTDGTVSTLAGTGAPGYADGPGSTAQFNGPQSLEVDDKGNVYVADSGNHRVQIFDPDGGFVAGLKAPPQKNHATDPTDVAVDATRNRCYVVDNDNHRILLYDLTQRKLIKTYGTPGTGKRAFRYPFLIALDQAQYLYIVDVINTRVQVLNPDGLFVNFIGGWGVEKGEFFRPKGVALDKKNRVYVSDSWMGVVQVFEPTGDFYAALGDGIKRNVKRFKTPVGLFIDTRNRLYVVEMFANKVSVYRLGEAFLSEKE